MTPTTTRCLKLARLWWLRPQVLRDIRQFNSYLSYLESYNAICSVRGINSFEKANCLSQWKTALFDKRNLEEARKQNRKLLIMIGEHHFSAHAFLINNIILNIARELGIRTLYLEVSWKILNKFKLYCALGLDIIDNIVERSPFINRIANRWHGFLNFKKEMLNTAIFVFRTLETVWH